MKETSPSSKKTASVTIDRSRDIPVLALQIKDFLDRKTDEFPEGLEQLRPVDLSKLFNNIGKSWHGKAESKRADKIFGLLRTDWKGGKAWIDAYIAALVLADKLNIENGRKARIVSDAIEFYGKSKEQTRGFVEKMGEQAAQLLVTSFQDWINNRSEAPDLHILITNWSTGFFVLLRTKKAGKKVIPGIREAVADELLLSIRKLDYESYQPVFSIDFIIFLQAMFLYASESARSKFAESEAGKNILAPSITIDRNESDTKGGGKRELADLRDVTTSESLLEVLRERLEQVDSAKSRLVQMEAKDKRSQLQKTVLSEERTKLDGTLQKTRQELRFSQSEIENERTAFQANEARLKEELASAESKIEKLAKDLDQLMHQKGSVQESHRKEFSGDIAKILDKEGKNSWELVNALGDDQKVLRVNIKNLLNKIAAKFEVKPPTG